MFTSILCMVSESIRRLAGAFTSYSQEFSLIAFFIDPASSVKIPRARNTVNC